MRKSLGFMLGVALLAGGMTGTAAAVSPTATLGPGDEIVYVSSNPSAEGIYRVTKDGTTQLTSGGTSDGYPRWSPDGRKIVFYSSRDGNNEIYVMDFDGSDQTNLTGNTASETIASWNPDMTKIVFNSDRAATTDIWSMDADGLNPVNLTNSSAGKDWAPDWSPNGAKIAFISNREGNGEIYVMNADGTGQTNLTNDPGGDYSPRWSRDSSRIVFQSDRDGDFELYVMGADGSNVTKLTSDTATNSSASWSPDGTQIAYSHKSTGRSEIWIMNADGSGKELLIPGSAGAYTADWGWAPSRFSDVGYSHTFYGDIEWLASAGITKGCNPPGNSLFCPDGKVTRGQMAAFLHRALGGVLTPGGPVTFVDDDGSIFEADIEWLGATGVTKGCNPPANDSFCPDSQVTRAQMAAFLYRALG